MLSNDVGLSGATVAVVSGPSNGTLVLNPDGSFTYTPNANFSGADGFTYSASLAGNSYPAQVTLNVSFANDAPVAAADAYVNTIGPNITVAAPGVLGNDADPDGDTLTAVLDSGSRHADFRRLVHVQRRQHRPSRTTLTDGTAAQAPP